MEYINKYQQQEEAEKIISHFLKELKENGEAYPKDLYEIFKSARNEKGQLLQDLLKKILLKEQNNRCCYCMRNLDGSDEIKTLEHLIPNKKINKINFNKYLNKSSVLNNQRVCFANDFINNEETIFPPYPHTIAYQNLAVSCDGRYFRSGSSIHCNNFRGHEEIVPFVLKHTINDEVEYKLNGFIIWLKETEYIPIFNKLGLNDNILRMIRRIWFYANNRHINPIELTDIQKEEFLYSMLSEVEENEFEMLLNFRNDNFWKLLQKYDYFAKYNLKKIARQIASLKTQELRGLLLLLLNKN